MQVLLKELVSKLEGWRPNADTSLLDGSLRGAGSKVEKGLAFGHPKSLTSSLCAELVNLGQNVHYVLERELLSLPDLQAIGGLRLLEGLALLCRSQYNQAVFLDADGLQSTCRIVRNAINQLHVCSTTASVPGSADRDNPHHHNKVGYLHSLLGRCMAVLAPFLDPDNLISRDHGRSGARGEHPLVACDVCSAHVVADYVELLQIIKSSGRWSLEIFKLQSAVLDTIRMAYTVNADSDLLDVGIVESIASLVGKSSCKDPKLLGDPAFFEVQTRALEVLATASRRHAVIVQHFLQSEGVAKVHQWMLLVLESLRGGGGMEVVGTTFASLEAQVNLCRENERYVESLLLGVFGLLSNEADLLWEYQWELAEDESKDAKRLAAGVLEFKKHAIKWVAMLLQSSKYGITLLRRHKCWEVLLGRNFFGLRPQRGKGGGGEGAAAQVMQDAMECQTLVASLLYKAITSTWNTLPEIEVKVLLREAHNLALQPGSCAQLLNVLRKYVNSFKISKTATVMDRADCSSGMARVIQRQKGAEDGEWELLASDDSFLAGVFEKGLEGSSLQTRTRTHVLAVLKDVFGCHVAVEEYFVKQWNAVGVLFSLVWDSELQDYSLGMVKGLLKMSPMNTDAQIAKSVLFTRYVEALPRAQVEIHTSGLKLVFLLLEGIQETIAEDASHQGLFNECETILHVFNLLNEDFSAEEGPELCRSVLKTLGYLISGNHQGRKHLERTVGWDTLQELVFHCVTTPIPYSIFLELYNIATDQILVRGEGRGVVHFVSVKLVPTMLNILRKCARNDARLGLRLIHSVLKQSIANCSACDYHGVTAQLLEWFQECGEEERELQDCIVAVVETVGKVSLSAKDLRSVLRTCYGCESTALDEVKLLQTVSILRKVVNQDGPTDFLDFDGVQSGLRWKGKSSWAGSKAYSFSVWLRFDTSNLQQTQGKVLYSLHGRATKGDHNFVVVVLESNRILIHTAESKLHSASFNVDVPVGSWFQLGIVHDNSSTFGSSTVALYVNGVKENVQKLKYPKNIDVLTGITVGCLDEVDTPHTMSKWLLSLKGQASSVFLFQDALSEKHMAQIYRIGPNFVFSRLIKGFNTGDVLFLALKVKARANGELYNVMQPGAPIEMSVLEGTHFCFTRVIKDMVQCIGGISAILTLFGQLYHNHAPKAKSSETLSSTLTQVFQLLEALMGASHLYMNDMLHMGGFPILGFLLRKADAETISAAMVEAIEDMLIWMLSAQDKGPFKQAFRHLLMDLNWWGSVSETARAPYVELLLRTLRTEYRLVSDAVQISHFLDVLRSRKSKGEVGTNAQGDRVCEDLLTRGYLEAIAVMAEKKFDEGDLVALLCFCNDNVDHDVTSLLIRRLNAWLKGQKMARDRFCGILSRVGGAGLLLPLAGSSNTFVCVEALELLLLGSGEGMRGEELAVLRVLLEDFGAKLASVELDEASFQRLVSLLKTGKYPELYAVSILFRILSKGEASQRKIVLSYCVKLLSKARHNVEVFVKKAAWQSPLAGLILDNLVSLPPECKMSLGKTGKSDVADEVAISWNILISLIFYCVRYKEDGLITVEHTMYHFMWGDAYRKEDSAVIFPQLVSDTFKMILLSDLATRSASDSWTAVEALECEACINNVVGILPLCQDILLGVFLPAKPGGEEEPKNAYDAVEDLRTLSMGKDSNEVDLCKELGLRDHVLGGAADGGPLPVHGALASEFCEVCVAIIYRLLFGSSAKCFAKYIKEAGRAVGGDQTAAEALGPPSPSRAGESLSPGSMQCVFQVTMYLFTTVLNSVEGDERARTIARDICSIVEYCIVSSHVLSNDLAIYIRAMDFLQSSEDIGDCHRALCKSMHRSLCYGAKGSGALEADVSKLLTTETIYRARAHQERALRMTTVRKACEEDRARVADLAQKQTRGARQLAATYSEQDASRRQAEVSGNAEALQEAESRYRHMQRKLRSEKGIWASGVERDLKWKLDRTEDYIRRRMKVKRLYNAREYTTREASLGEKEKAEVAAAGRLIKNLPVKAASEEEGDAEDAGLRESQDLQDLGEGEAAASPEQRLQRSESVSFDDAAFSAECKLVTAKRVVPGALHIHGGRVYFSGKVQEHSNLFGKGTPDPSFGKTKRLCIEVSEIREIHFMRYMLEHSACEIFLQHRGVFLAFQSREEMKRAVKRITVLGPSILVVSRRKRLALAELYSSQWRKGDLSNFNYLMKLNTLAGRTFNDLSQYPVFPWVLSDYESQEIDLSDPKVFRDLSKPVGALDDKRRAVFSERYELSVQADDPSRAFHYGSHYSTAGIVLYFLIRIEPFTFLHSVLQGGKLDHADRLFNSVAATWQMCNTHTADVKELIPEFFCLPEMFENLNSIDFGTCQDGQTKSEVALPPWAKGSPNEFCRIHKRALESDYVSANLHSWVDLVFGYKQRGKAAVEAVNVFHYLSYEGSVDLTAIEDENERKVVTDHVLLFGQTPSQLFRRKLGPRTARPKPGPWEGGGAGIMAVAKTRVSPPRPIRFASMAAPGRLVVVDQDALVHYYRWTTPRDVSFTFGASASPAYALEHDKTTDSLQRQYGSSVGASDNHFAVLARAGCLLSVGHWDNSVRCYGLDDFRCLQSVSCHKDAVTCVAVGLEERVVVTGSRDTTVIVWGVEPSALKAKTAMAPLRENPSHILCGHQDEVACLALSVPLDLVISSSIGGDILFHALQSGEYVRQMQLPSGDVPTRMALHANGVLAVYCQRDLSLYALTLNAKVLSKVELGERISHLSFTHEGEHLVLGGEKGTLSVRDAYSLDQCHKFDATVGITSLVLTQEDCLIATNRNGEVLSVHRETPAKKK